MLLGYNTNGFAHHKIGDTLAILSEIGFQAVALTLEPDQLDPPTREGVRVCLNKLGPFFETGDLSVTIETGSRFILDPRRKHQPTLISALGQERERRIEFLKAAIDIASALQADSVSLWSGSPDNDADADDLLFHRLTGSLQRVLQHAEDRDVRLSFEPEPGMFIDRMDRFARLHSLINHPLFGLTLDIGHVHCLADGDLMVHLKRWRNLLWNIHMEDIKRGIHEHLMFGEGEIDFDQVFAALKEIDYRGPLQVELSRHSHNAVETARQAFTFLKRHLS